MTPEQTAANVQRRARFMRMPPEVRRAAWRASRVKQEQRRARETANA